MPHFPVERRRSHGVLWSFLLVVVLPTLLASVYFNWIVTPQYVTKAVVALRIGDSQRGGGGGPSSLVAALGPSTSAAPVTQSYGIVDYIHSVPAMEDVQRAGLDVRSILTSTKADPIVRLRPDSSTETLFDAWRSHVKAQFELSRGVLTISTRAFTATESLALAEAVLASSERLANDMSQRVIADSMRLAEQQVETARGRFNAALAEMQSFRTTSGVLDPSKASASGTAIELQLRQDLAVADAQAEALRAGSGPGSPMYAAAAARARALRAQLADAGSQSSRSAGDRSSSSWAEILSQNEALTAALRIAEQYFTQALGLAQSSQMEAARQRSYVVTYVRPVLASEASYPNATLSILMVAGSALIAWAMATLLYHAILDRT
ncbi:hypothetical protein [Roseomonas sp. KE2513]|uniref:hypothetical protein n=1 Tax=Roseomonas sp. KE2513 TaxID=2479202 RepID=UPI0018DF6B77|nr:hypothetical protein [Roseomonas sp. KE2513]